VRCRITIRPPNPAQPRTQDHVVATCIDNDDGRELGRLIAWRGKLSDGREAMQVANITVVPRARRRGVATQLYEAAAEQACAKGVPLASDKSTSRSASAESFWRKQFKKGRAECIRRLRQQAQALPGVRAAVPAAGVARGSTMIKRGHKPDCPGCVDPEKFHLFTAAYLTELLRKGAEEATELNELLRDQFTLDATARNLVLR
jgi:GNAT superfamily N-acetyltransferase